MFQYRKVVHWSFSFQGPNKDEILKKFNALLDDYLKGNNDVIQVADSYKELKVPDKFAKDIIFNALNSSLDKTGM